MPTGRIERINGTMKQRENQRVFVNGRRRSSRYRIVKLDVAENYNGEAVVKNPDLSRPEWARHIADDENDGGRKQFWNKPWNLKKRMTEKLKCLISYIKYQSIEDTRATQDK